jgi:predicted DsbA family dithiol-disulfide isomerase
MNEITVFGDVCCPFTYAGLEMLRNERDGRNPSLVIRVRAWPLEWINGHPLDPDHVAREIEGLRSGPAPDLFAGFDPHAFPATSIPAFGLVQAAGTTDPRLGERAAYAVREAVFEQGLDVSHDAVLDRIAYDLGIGPRPDLAACEAAVRDDYEAGKSLGVVGSPHFVTRLGSWFCPLLHIEQADGRFTVSVDETRRAEFLQTVFG